LSQKRERGRERENSMAKKQSIMSRTQEQPGRQRIIGVWLLLGNGLKLGSSLRRKKDECCQQLPAAATCIKLMYKQVNTTPPCNKG
jgi:hypothetical protein